MSEGSKSPEVISNRAHKSTANFLREVADTLDSPFFKSKKVYRIRIEFGETLIQIPEAKAAIIYYE